MKTLFPYISHIRLKTLLSCGRLHTSALDDVGNIWNFVSWGRPFRLVSTLLDKSSPESMPVQVESGWAFTSVLTESGDVLVWWPRGSILYDKVRNKNTELDQSDIRPRGTLENEARKNKHNGKYIDCYAWDLFADPVRLPPVPVQNLPDLSNTNLPPEKRNEGTKLVKIAAMDNFIIGLTNKGHVLRYTKLYDEVQYELGRWEYVGCFTYTYMYGVFLTVNDNSFHILVNLTKSKNVHHLPLRARTFKAALKLQRPCTLPTYVPSSQTNLSEIMTAATVRSAADISSVQDLHRLLHRLQINCAHGVHGY